MTPRDVWMRQAFSFFFQVFAVIDFCCTGIETISGFFFSRPLRDSKGVMQTGSFRQSLCRHQKRLKRAKSYFKMCENSNTLRCLWMRRISLSESGQPSLLQLSVWGGGAGVRECSLAVPVVWEWDGESSGRLRMVRRVRKQGRFAHLDVISSVGGDVTSGPGSSTSLQKVRTRQDLSPKLRVKCFPAAERVRGPA